MYVRRLLFLIFVVMVGVYALYESRGVLFAPRLDIIEPANGALLHTTDIAVRGRTDPGAVVWIAGRNVQSNEEGYFEDIVPGYPGFNEIGIMVKNRFGKEIRTSIKFFVQ